MCDLHFIAFIIESQRSYLQKRKMMKFKDYGTRTKNLGDTNKKMSGKRQISALINSHPNEEICQ
jgi:hypothetical protein